MPRIFNYIYIIIFIFDNIFLDKKINGVLVATCMHDSNDKYFHHKFMDYTKKEAVAILKEKIDGGF